jgi:hypothetical protein
MKITIGRLEAIVFATHERCFHNTELAAVATQVELENLTGMRRLRVGMFEASSAASSSRSDAWERAS